MQALAMSAAGLELPAPRFLSGAASASEGACASGSLASSSTDLQQLQQAEQQQQQAEASQRGSLDGDIKTHHLLKHCLSASQRGHALQHFHTGDTREAAKEIARMGQRELQAKFKEVYGSATKSNNNSWLRRKLYEAVGVTPLKASTKGKARKSHAPAHGSHARKPAAPKDAARAPKVAPVRTKRPGGADLAAGSPLYGGGGGMSVLDPHHQQNSEDSTDSDGGSGGTPRSAPLAAFDGTVFSGQPLGGAALPPPPPGFVPVAVAEPQSPTAGGAHWADQGSHWAAPVPALSPFVAAASRQLAPVEAGSGLADFRPVGSSSEPACPASDLAAGHWYFGSLDLACLCPTPMDCGAAAACTAPSCCRDDEDEVPLLTLDLGAIDMSV